MGPKIQLKPRSIKLSKRMQDKVLCYSAKILKLYCKDNQFFKAMALKVGMRKTSMNLVTILMPRSMPSIVFKKVPVSAWAKTY